MPAIDYFLSLNSPWTYLGSARFIDLVRRHGDDEGAHQSSRRRFVRYCSIRST